ncbi:FixH family protein [Hyphomonas johnsonii]|uniref:FixH family protein n=1 Tax=Hyphomonas johnsonii MHS-2 TaxID=1280950 RepID=A0A059FSF3_9PROT|nr:FixH family protein [Hyphomonas johnsonii]KCZ93403.1 FixH family protein [Hyphomonas johnsonii MHS-2]
MSTANIKSASGDKTLKGYQVLFWLLGFFGLMFVVNGIFLFYAITSFPGEDVKKSYLQGLNYNATLEQRAEQARLGWQAAVGLEGDMLVVYLEESTGEPLTGKSVNAALRRPATTNADHEFDLISDLGGRYHANVGDLQAGQWEIIAQVRDAESSSPKFVARKTITIR